jgi:hypothetical protein
MGELTMVTGSCLCGSVQFEFAESTGQFVLCHCKRCRKFSGSAFFAVLIARDFTFRCGEEHIVSYEAPILVTPPPYRKDFCNLCGSPVPWPAGESDLYAVPAGSLDEDPGVRPEGHIWRNQAAPWYVIGDGLPQYTDAEFVLHRVQEWDRNGEERAAAGYEYILHCYPDAIEVVSAAVARLAQLRGSDAR